jgi:hypothetical protein
MRKILHLAIPAAAVLGFLSARASADLAPPVFYETGAIQEGVAIVDLDGDGDNDLAVIHRNGSLKTLANLGAGTFAPAVDRGILWPSETATEIETADVDRDGDQDLLVSFTTTYGSISVVRNRGNGTFDPPENYDTCYSTQMLVAADFNGDKRVDLAGDSNCFQATIMLNNGDGTFRHNGEYGRGYTPGGIDAGDLDGDGDLEVAFGNGTSDVTVLPGLGDGSFGPHGGQAVHHNPRGVKMADFDADGDLDIVTSNTYSNFVSLLRNDGTGQFPPPEDYFPGFGTMNLAIGDFDRDGDVDLVVANRDNDHISILHNPGNGVFTNRHDEPTGDGPEDVARGDLDGDALPDVAVTHWDSSRVAVYLNATVVTPDADGDGVRDAEDCAPTNGSAWELPGAIDDLLLDGASTTRLSWTTPKRTGASVPVFDVLRSGDAADFSAAACVEAGGTDSVASEVAPPAPLLAYLVRVRNACGANAGNRSDGVPRVAAACP